MLLELCQQSAEQNHFTISELLTDYLCRRQILRDVLADCAECYVACPLLYFQNPDDMTCSHTQAAMRLREELMETSGRHVELVRRPDGYEHMSPLRKRATRPICPMGSLDCAL